MMRQAPCVVVWDFFDACDPETPAIPAILALTRWAKLFRPSDAGCLQQGPLTGVRPNQSLRLRLV
jgi:hypothetical protein